MKWTKFTLDTTTEAVDLISDMLSDYGIEGIEIIDNVPITDEEKKQMFVDILPILEKDDGTAKVSFYVDPKEDQDLLLQKIRKGLKELSNFVSIGSGNIEISETEDKDWLNNWKQFFKPFRIDEDILIKPTWEELSDVKEKDLVIEIDPGISFGTGSHETTKLCILSLKKYLKENSTVLDAGSGSGILSILAKKLGARAVLGIDIDEHATKSAIENAQVNHLPTISIDSIENDINKLHQAGGLGFVTGNIIEDDGIRQQIGKDMYDIVVANILADVIIPLAAVITENLKKDGIYIVSGIINTKEKEVQEALLSNHFTILETNRMGDWVSFVAQK
ncbi:MAG TPA: 50S ribosomal protein L11 methyltransferase [Clostridiales bacterium]|jgi:ribosomal protein L11 methyltransferase|nr:50S ribosomal protein L11 methyltransferase [Clostridiales bacterium]